VSDNTESSPVPDPASGLGDDALTDRDIAILEFENRWWQHAGQKEEAIRDAFQISPTRYYQLLGAVIDSPAALRHDPMLVKRLHRMQDARQATRRARARSAAD
jgi:transcription initiation factor TFIIIB Brf1 subunit/transcription initiation factor TFIIB